MPGEESNRPFELVTVAEVSSPVEADTLKAVLESFDIRVMLRSDTVTNSSFRSVNVGPMADIQLMVSAQQAEEAKAILGSMEGMEPTEEEWGGES